MEALEDEDEEEEEDVWVVDSTVAETTRRKTEARPSKQSWINSRP
jgi:hypothetical protein